VGIAHGGVGDQGAFLRQQPVGEFFGAELVEQLFGAVGADGAEIGGDGDAGFRRGAFFAAGFGVAVDRDVGVVSIKRVVYLLAMKSGWFSRASRKARLVATPRMRYSRSARSMRLMTSSDVGAQAVTFSSSAS
jgi:hypothetical protein